MTICRSTPTHPARMMLAAVAVFAAAGCGPATATPVQSSQDAYFPGAGDRWEWRTPEQVGMNAGLLEEALEFARASEVTAPRDLLENHALSFGREPHGEAIGPFKERGDAAGVVLRHGYLVAEWGDPHRVDPTFSVTKSFLSTTVGLAYDRGLIHDLDDTVREYFAPVVALHGPPGGAGAAAEGALQPPADGGPMLPSGSVGRGAAWDAFEVILPFESEHNRKITWDHLLRQTSDWQGTLWGKPDWADRPRGDLDEWRTRERFEPGTNYMYNDVRVNLLALASLNVWRQPLPEVLKEHVMDPIGASNTWRWFGYDNSWVVLDGRMVQSVSGGAHWGGGMWISARDMARFGYLTLRRGKWGDQQILSDEWIDMALTPGTAGGSYGFMNFSLSVSPECGDLCPFRHVGAGPNIVYVNPEHDLVIVTRWTNTNGVIQRVLAAIEESE